MSETPPAVPRHIVFIPDGNRRWAKLHGKPLLEGHSAGIDNLRSVAAWCRDAGVKTVTFWGFSSENFSRDRSEVEGLMRLFVSKFEEFKDHSEVHKNKVRVRFFGRLGMLPSPLRGKLREVEKETESHSDYLLNILIAYGGRQEIVDACNAAIADAKAGRISGVTEESFGKYVYMSGIEEPDLIVRTSGEMRLSGVLPWQSGYSELYFPEALWPDFSEADFKAALAEFAKRKRRFGK
ncbi:MAG: polyprenyl diphosphate synthase [Candidatus ainarchaeum sp.]|nr:polyprenyl diphosphate synthase [Candidatus ainarchaeum sp.]